MRSASRGERPGGSAPVRCGGQDARAGTAAVSSASSELRASRERGSVTAEFALALPAIILVLLLCLNALALLAAQVRLVDAAGQASRLAAREVDAASILRSVEQIAPGSSVRSSQRDGLHCVAIRQQRAVVGFVPITLGAEQCAQSGGR